MMKQLGVGLGLAVLIDGTVIRGVLLLATMQLLGEWNWYLPKRLEWVPTLTPRRARRGQPLSPRAARRSRFQAGGSFLTMRSRVRRWRAASKPAAKPSNGWRERTAWVRSRFSAETVSW